MPSSFDSLPISRRELLRLSGMGMGSIALGSLLAGGAVAAGDTPGKFDLKPKAPPLPARAKSVILMMQNGGPSQMDLFEHKPELTRHHGKQHSFKVETFQNGSESNRLLATPFEFRRRGRCGMELSDVIPNIGSVADEICLVRSMHTGHNNHTEGLIMFMTGKLFQGRPTFGSWISYALGTANQSLPAYVVLRDPAGYNTTGTLTWTSGWLPALYRGTEFSTAGAPVLDLHPARERPAGTQRKNLAFLDRLNRHQQTRYPHESALETRIQNYELAARMQLEAMNVLDTSAETEFTHKLYGLDAPATAAYGARCLLARKLVEAGVRFVQIHPKPLQPWDSHANTEGELKDICSNTDLPTAGLIQDLKMRGLLDETIIVWAGEFGRLPISQNGTGRDHNRNAFSLFVAGGGFKAGHIHGATDEVGYAAVEGRVSVSDLHATILHQLGIDHENLTYHHAGRDETLTDSSLTGARVVHELIG